MSLKNRPLRSNFTSRVVFGHIVPNRRRVILFAWQKWFSCIAREWKIYCSELALWAEAQTSSFGRPINSKEHAAHALCIFLTIGRIKLFICGITVAVVVVVSSNPYRLPLCGIHEQIKWSFQFNRLLFHYFLCGSGYDGLWLNKPWDIFYLKII